jgi:hypothetical protein
MEAIKAREIFMSIDVHDLSKQLLERLANSIHDRDANNNHFCFNVAEIEVTEQWLQEIIDEVIENACG